jgi:hypothetical protein
VKHDDLEKRVSAYVDGALRGPKREQLERELAGDSLLAQQVTRSRALGRLVREAWTEGPPAPSPEYLLSAIRPALAEIDRERNARPVWQRALDAAFARIAAAVRPSPAFATAAAVAFVAALALMPRLEVANGLLSGNLVNPGSNPAEARVTSESSPLPPTSPSTFLPASIDFGTEGIGSVYDLSPGRPAVLFRAKDGSTTLWLIDEGDHSSRFPASGGWG